MTQLSQKVLKAGLRVVPLPSGVVRGLDLCVAGAALRLGLRLRVFLHAFYARAQNTESEPPGSPSAVASGWTTSFRIDRARISARTRERTWYFPELRQASRVRTVIRDAALWDPPSDLGQIPGVYPRVLCFLGIS
jgi:hypothetical protein